MSQPDERKSARRAPGAGPPETIGDGLGANLGSAPYDLFAWFYDRHWAQIFAGKALEAVEALVLPYIPMESRILDLCCGCGHLTSELAGRGYRPIGLDASLAMLQRARSRSPGVSWLQADARRFCLRPVQEAAVCLFDSVNHLSSVDDLARAFCCVRESLTSGGLFLFDFNSELGFKERWVSEYEVVAEDGSCRLTGGYDPVSRLGRYQVSLQGTGRESWRRADFEIVERCHSEEEIRAALDVAGLLFAELFDAVEDLGMPDEIGRFFCLAQVPGGAPSQTSP